LTSLRLLPKTCEAGWTPYGWLAYLLIFLTYPFFGRATTSDWALTALGVGAFLPFYFWG